MGLFDRRDDRELIPIGWALALVLGAAVGIAVLLLGLAWAVLGAPSFVREQVGLSAYLDIVKIVLAVVAGIGGVVALVVAYRKQRTGERAEQREHTRLLNERFNLASEQLGSEKPAVRLAGVHAMVNLADDWDEYEGRQMCIDVLCSYLRMAEVPSSPDPIHENDPDENQSVGDESVEGEAETDDDRERGPRSVVDPDRETRHTILRTIAAHLRKGGTRISWAEHQFDLRGITIDLDLDFTGAVFELGMLDLTYARIISGTMLFWDARFVDGAIMFFGTRFRGGVVAFNGARFEGAVMTFNSARFSGATVSFYRAQVTDGSVLFNEARFTAGAIGFDEVDFAGGRVSFEQAQFAGGRVSFDHANFSGGQVLFLGMQLGEGEVSFQGATYSGAKILSDKESFPGS